MIKKKTEGTFNSYESFAIEFWGAGRLNNLQRDEDILYK